MQLSLNGTWEVGIDRQYDHTAPVPGLADDPTRVTSGTLWYRREVALPAGAWTHATLVLNGARFCPAVYVNGAQVSATSGGMTVTTHLLASAAVVPGSRITLEIALLPLDQVDPGDASRIPAADLWRSNVSSCLWDSVTLRLHGPARLTRIIPFTDVQEDRLSIHWESENLGAIGGNRRMAVQVLDQDGRIVVEHVESIAGTSGSTAAFSLAGACRPWSPEHPHLYRLRVLLLEGTGALDAVEMPFGLKEFRTEGLAFRLNGAPVTFRAGSVVWHRWLRDPEARALAFDTAWFEEHIVRRLKSHGANALRFHLGTPPEALLDLCDQHGLLVQIEWSFFHGMKGSKESLLRQWRDWFDLCMRHPSVCVIHPWNETEGDELETAFAAIDEIAPEYPPLVIAHRDTLHVHKYWWGLFENVGVYYDSAEQFPQPIIVDEFGGNYLDGNCVPGGYPALKESFLRFLGRGHTPELRLQLHTEANARVAEYWRRIGAAGFSPFCILGSPEDGNHHFLGALAEGNPKPVWEALTAAYAPLSSSLDVWDRNFMPGQRVTLPLAFFNETDEAQTLRAMVRIVPEADHGTVLTEEIVTCATPAHGIALAAVTLSLPEIAGEWRFQAILQDRSAAVTHPIVSCWRFRTLAPCVPEALRAVRIAIPDGEEELAAFLRAHGLATCDMDAAQLVVTSAPTWGHLAGDPALRQRFEDAIERGCSVVMLNVGPMALGQGYLDGGDLGPLQGAMYIADPEVTKMELFCGVSLTFREMPEPESCLHPAEGDDSLWEHLPQQATWLWNGLRGGLIVPASDMAPTGLNPEAFLSLWQSRGADPALVRGEQYLAYELAGFYAFSPQEDEAVKRALRAKVQFLVEDAPALAIAINPNAPILTHDLAVLYRESANGRAERLTALANCGKSLARTPVVRIAFGPGKGALVLSQLITNGRLAPGFGQPGQYGLRYDPAAVQCVLNMLATAVTATAPAAARALPDAAV